ncbi:hypothetical protein ACFOSV_05810 [Algoriphagus namhaensis]|uniref:Uncharacterized protein n=1 Tax=Algoriphagus namhaensis TaxID=915353 RepID=A0ABV8APL2_9BACT
MMSKKDDLAKKSEELEQTLSQQLSLLQNDSKDYLKFAGIALAGGLLTYAIIHRKSRKKEQKIEKAMALLEKEGLLSEEIEERLTKPAKSSFWPTLSQRLLILGLAFAKEKILPELLNPSGNGEDQGADL